jgi:hypothetical protein
MGPAKAKPLTQAETQLWSGASEFYRGFFMVPGPPVVGSLVLGRPRVQNQLFLFRFQVASRLGSQW